MDEGKLRAQLCRAAQQLWMCRLAPGADAVVTAELHRRRYLTTPGRRRLADLTPDELICVDTGGACIQSGAALDQAMWRPHRVAYQAALSDERLRIGATVEAPAIHAMALAGCDGRGGAAVELEMFGRLPVIEPGDDAALIAALPGASVVVLCGRGVLAVGPDLAEAVCRLERAEHAAAIALARPEGC